MSKVRNFKNFIGCIGLVGVLVAHVSTQCLAEEGWPTNHSSNRETAYSLFVATNGSGKSLIGGRRYDFTTKKFYGWIQQVSSATGIGDSAFHLPGTAPSHVENDVLDPLDDVLVPDPGSDYLDLSNSKKESLCASAVWVNPNWWVLCRSLTTDNKYVIYLVKATTTGTVTVYPTDLGGGTGNNYHAVPGKQGSLLYDSGNLVVVGQRGQNLTGDDSVKYRPFIATFTVADAPADPTTTNWASTVEDFSDTDGDAYNHKAIAVTKAGSNYFAIYTKINNSQGNLRIAKFSTALVASTGTYLFNDITGFPSPFNSSPVLAPTALLHYSTNSTTVYVAGSIKSSSSGVWNGFVGAFGTSNGAWVTSCDSDGFNSFQVQSGKDTLLNDMIMGCTSYAMLSGGAHNGTNYKAYTGRMNLTSHACAFDGGYGTGGIYFHSEGIADTIYVAAAMCGSTNQFINVGRQTVLDGDTGVFRHANYYRTFTSCSVVDPIPYITSCTDPSIPSFATEGDVFTNKTSTFTYSNSTTATKNVDLLTCSNLPGRSGSTLTAVCGHWVGSCWAGGRNSPKCNDYDLNVVCTTTTTSTTTTTTTTMCDGSGC